MYTIYLAGDLTSWREIVKEELEGYNINLIDPLEFETQNALGNYISDEYNAIKNSDLVFAYLYEDSPSDYFGSTCEMQFAFDNNIPILMINERNTIHPFHAYISKYIKSNMKSGIIALKSLIESGNEFLVDYAK